MGVIRDTLSKIFPKRKQDKQPLKQEESNLLPEEKPVVEQVSKDMIESTIAEISKNSNETKETQIQPLSAAEKVARLGKSVGFDVRVMTPDEAKNKSDKAKAVQVETNGNLKPSIDDLYLIRATDIFPEDSTMKPISNSLRMASFTTPYFIDRVLTQEAAKLGIKQKNGKPVTCRTDLNNVELSQELIDYLNNLDLGQDFEGHRTHPTDRLIASVKHKAISKFELPLRSTRETVHFTMNSRVSSHSGGNWENLPFIFIEPYKPHHGTFRSVGGFDSWKKGDVHLESPTLLTRPETLEQLIELSKTNPGIKSTLKDCKVVLMNTEQTHDSHYVNAILHEQGAPAYVCGDTFVLAVESDKNQNNQIQAKGFEDALKEISAELREKGIPTFCSVLHASTPEANEEKKAATCEGYDATLKFARFLANKINHKGLSDKIKEFEALDTPEKMEAFYRTTVIRKIEQQCTEASKTNDPNTKIYFEKYQKAIDVLKTSDDERAREAGMKEFLSDSIMDCCAPILDQMSDDKVSRLCTEFTQSYTADLEKQFPKPVKFETVKSEQSPQRGE